MNKITSTLAGLAIAATAGTAPAFAQGNLFTPPGTFSFSTGAGGNVSVIGTGATFNPFGGGMPTTGVNFTLLGAPVSGNLFAVTSLVATSGATTLISETNPTGTFGGPFQFFVATLPSSGTAISSVGAATDGTTFNLVNPVPEASTVVSFGALLAVGGLAVVARRKKQASLTA